MPPTPATEPAPQDPPDEAPPAPEAMTLAERRLLGGQARSKMATPGPDASLRRTVHLTDPANGQLVAFLPGEPVPLWAREAITNPNAWASAREARRSQFDSARSNVATVVEEVEAGRFDLDEARAAEQEREGGPRQTLLRELGRIERERAERR